MQCPFKVQDVGVALALVRLDQEPQLLRKLRQLPDGQTPHLAMNETAKMDTWAETNDEGAALRDVGWSGVLCRRVAPARDL